MPFGQALAEDLESLAQALFRFRHLALPILHDAELPQIDADPLVIRAVLCALALERVR
jgi:hypothetical protein